MTTARAVLAGLAADLVDARSFRDGVPWGLVAGDLDALHLDGRTLADLAEAVRRDLGGGGPVDGTATTTATIGSG